MNENERWVQIAENVDEIDFKKNNIACVQINGKSICVIKTIDGLKACSSKCPHASGDLSSGLLDKKENIICPVHSYRFSINTGRDTGGEGYFLKIYKIKKTEKGIFIKLE